MGHKKCDYVKQGDIQCEAPAMVDSQFCFFHSPETIEPRHSSRAKGGAKNASATLPVTIVQISIPTAQGVLSLIAETIHHVRTGQLDPKIANCVSYLSGIALKAIDQGNIDERLESLEAAIKNKTIKVEKDFSRDEDQIFSFENGGSEDARKSKTL